MNPIRKRIKKTLTRNVVRRQAVFTRIKIIKKLSNLIDCECC